MAWRFRVCAGSQDRKPEGASLQDHKLEGAGLQDRKLEDAGSQDRMLEGAGSQDRTLEGAGSQDRRLKCWSTFASRTLTHMWACPAGRGPGAPHRPEARGAGPRACVGGDDRGGHPGPRAAEAGHRRQGHPGRHVQRPQHARRAPAGTLPYPTLTHARRITARNLGQTFPHHL